MNTRFLRSNLLIVLAYVVAANVLAFGQTDGESVIVLVWTITAVFIHVCVLLTAALVYFFQGRKSEAGQRVVTSVVVAVIGYCTCWGVGMLADLYSGLAIMH